MPEKQETFTRTCCRCKCEYESTAQRSYVCPDCQMKNKRNLDRFRKNDYKRPRRIIPAQYSGLFARVREVDRYNAEHGTRLSYGKYELLKFFNKI